MSFCKKSKPTEACYSTILSDRRATITIPDVAPGEWIKLNPGTVGFYRTKYPTELLQQFVPSIEDKSLPPLDRLGLVDDLFALVRYSSFVSARVVYQYLSYLLIVKILLVVDSIGPSENNRRSGTTTIDERRR